MGLDYPRVDTADVGRLLLRLRDEIEATRDGYILTGWVVLWSQTKMVSIIGGKHIIFNG